MKELFIVFFRLPDVGEEAIINYDGKEVPINVNMLNDIRKLGFGNYGSVMLAEVQNHPEIKMAVKVCFNWHDAGYSKQNSSLILFFET